MSHVFPRINFARIGLSSALLLALFAPPVAIAQMAVQQPVNVNVSLTTQRIEMTVNTSRLLTLDQVIPRAQVNNPGILELTPLSTKQLQIYAKKTGVTQINLWDSANQVKTIDVIVFGDAQELHATLRSAFPSASLRIMPLNNSVMISGFVNQPEQVSRIIRIAEEFYPKVINNINVGGVQQVLLQVKIMEVSRTKLRSMGFDFSAANGTDYLVSSVSGLIAKAGGSAGLGGDNVRFGLVDGNNQFFGFLEALRQNNLLKILAEPTLVTVSGRPANFRVGGEFPIVVPGGLGTVSIEYKTFGTEVDFVPIVQGNGLIRLEVRPRVSELDSARGVTINNITVPGLNVRQVDTAVEMRAGQTFALAGLIQNRVESTNGGIPLLADIPFLGMPFRHVRETNNEIELLIMVTPEIIAPMEPHEVPQFGPGMHSVSPKDAGFYFNGHMEVPNPNLSSGGYAPPNGQYENIPPGAYQQPAPGQNFETQQPPLQDAPFRVIPTPPVDPSSFGPDSGQVTINHVEQPSRNATVYPIPTSDRLPDNRNYRLNATTGNGSTPANTNSFGPGLIGPIGYDLQQ